MTQIVTAKNPYCVAIYTNSFICFEILIEDIQLSHYKVLIRKNTFFIRSSLHVWAVKKCNEKKNIFQNIF